MSTCVRLFVFVHKLQTIYISPAVALFEGLRRPPIPLPLRTSSIFSLSYSALKVVLIISALISLLNEELNDTQQFVVNICRFYLRFSNYALMETYLQKSLLLLHSLHHLDRRIETDVVAVDSISARCVVAFKYWKLSDMKARTRDSARWLNRSFGSQLFTFYTDTAINLSCLAGELIILVHHSPDNVWTAAPRLLQCVAALTLTVFMATIGSDITSTCLKTQFRIQEEGSLGNELRAVFIYRPEWDGLRVIDSVPHDLSTIAGAVVNIVTFVAIVLQFDVTVSEAVSAHAPNTNSTLTLPSCVKTDNSSEKTFSFGNTEPCILYKISYCDLKRVNYISETNVHEKL